MAALGLVDELKESRLPRDDDDHGTHTRFYGNRIVGCRCKPIWIYELEQHVRFVARAKVAIYKVSWNCGYFSFDILVVMDKAIDDGVNVLSMSFSGSTFDYYRDNVAIRAFTTIKKGIVVSCFARKANDHLMAIENESNRMILFFNLSNLLLWNQEVEKIEKN
ncbi:unnamed protein product [Dovyalis caffra]|uniref:Peptidase S8/S53 domain-containing protein n=1 Tax=Dovyalis caffra TaxID=77055 RepID=A0AAV1RBH3_9ROSI|nr:unnamed protein product [Dovyalis caffra]